MKAQLKKARADMEKLCEELIEDIANRGALHVYEYSCSLFHETRLVRASSCAGWVQNRRSLMQ